MFSMMPKIFTPVFLQKVISRLTSPVDTACSQYTGKNNVVIDIFIVCGRKTVPESLWLPEVWLPRWLHLYCCVFSCFPALPDVHRMSLVVCPPATHPAPPMQHLTQTGQSKLLDVQKKDS